MTHLRLAALTSTLALVAGPALADTTAEQVWDNWRSLTESYGMELATTDETMAGDTLTVSGVSIKTDVAPEGTFEMTVGDIAFRELGDGSVAVQFPDTMPIAMDMTSANGNSATISIMMRQPGLSLIASGDDTRTRYDYDAPEITFGEVTIAGDEVPEELDFDIDVTATGNSGFFEVTSGGMRSFDSVTNTDALAMLFDFADPSGDEGRMEVRLEMQDMAQETSGQIGQVAMDMSLSEMIGGGMRQTGLASYGPVKYTVAAETPDGAFRMAAAADSGTLDVSIDEDGIAYGGTNTGATFTIAGDMIPLPPLSFSMAESGGRFAIPVVPGDESQDLQIVMRFVDLQVDDMLWNMFDPGQSLPRDPATLIIDLSGRATLTEDFTDPEYAETPDTPPGQIDALDLNELKLSIAGAELTGDGAFTFDNSFGMPMPQGTANLALNGVNALMDKLVVMGLLPQDQAMGARMMMGLFARPGDGEDSLVSTIELKADGSVFANGQRIK